jgi:putative two-component system response regulator
VADVFDAITCRRPYRTGFPFDVARGKIVEGSGSHFDPDMVKAFMALGDSDLRAIMDPEGMNPPSQS